MRASRLLVVTLTLPVNTLKNFEEEKTALEEQESRHRSLRETSTHCVGTVVYPRRFLRVAVLQELSIKNGAAVQVHLDANGSALEGVPVNMIGSDHTCNQRCDRLTYPIATN